MPRPATPKQMTRMTRNRAGQMTAPKSCAIVERFLPPACEAGGWGRRSGGCHGLGTQTIFYFLKNGKQHPRYYFFVVDIYGAKGILFWSECVVLFISFATG